MYYEKYIKYKTKYLQLKGGDKIYTFMIKTSYLNVDDFTDIIMMRGNYKLDDKPKNYVDFFYIDGTALKDKSLYDIKSTIKSVVDYSKQYQISNKDRLYNNFMKKFPDICSKYMMKEYDIKGPKYNISSDILDSKIHIIKPVLSGLGIGNEVLTSYDDYKKYLDQYMTKFGKHGWILEEYIDRPLLYNDYKYHLRVYFLYFKHNGVKKGYIFHKARMLLSLEKYKYGDYGNKKIHDSHYKGQLHTEFPTKFIETYGQENSDKVLDQMKEIHHYLLQLLDSDPYPSDKYAFEVFGNDLMVLPTFDVKLIECNAYVSLAHNPDMREFFKEFMAGIMQETVDKVLIPKNKIEQNDYFIDVTKLSE